MKRRTTTAQINEALTNNLLAIKKAECYHKDSRETDLIDAESFIEDFQFLCESGCFMNCIGWHFEKDNKTDSYTFETGAMDGDSEIIITIFLHVNDNENIEDIERILKIEEE